MANTRKLTGQDLGYDDTNHVQQLLKGTETTFLLISATGDGLNVMTDDPSIATASAGANAKDKYSKNKELTDWERNEDVIQVITIAAKDKEGRTTFRARKPNGQDWVKPIQINVVSDLSLRQARSPTDTTQAFREELQKLPLRDAVLRVADDQRFSRVGFNSDGSKNGFGVYDNGADKDWCGAFAWFCWETACNAKGVENPFGRDKGQPFNVLYSGFKAVSTGNNRSQLTVVGFQGLDPMVKGKNVTLVQRDETNVKRGDLAIISKGGQQDELFAHVCLVDEVSLAGGKLITVDGNQGSPKCITRNDRSAMLSVKFGSIPQIVFVHYNG